MALNPKQRQAIELLTCGLGMKYKDIAKECGTTEKTLWNWRNGREFTEFQEELQKMNDARWQAAQDAAMNAAISLCRQENPKMVEFVLKNCGYNPTQKIEGDINSTITINFGEEEEEE